MCHLEHVEQGVDDPRVSGGLAGVIGTLVVLGLGSGLFLVLRRRERDPPRARERV